MSGEQDRDPPSEAIDAQLRRAFDDVLSEDVPDRFLQLIEDLKKSEKDADDPEGSPQ